MNKKIELIVYLFSFSLISCKKNEKTNQYTTLNISNISNIKNPSKDIELKKLKIKQLIKDLQSNDFNKINDILDQIAGKSEGLYSDLNSLFPYMCYILHFDNLEGIELYLSLIKSIANVKDASKTKVYNALLVLTMEANIFKEINGKIVGVKLLNIGNFDDDIDYAKLIKEIDINIILRNK